jgi:folate-binding protein YgfZ
MSDLATDYRFLRTAAGALWLARDAVRVSGPDARDFLQGQCSQDLASLVVGQSDWSLVLEPQGKVSALVRVTLVDEDVLILDTDGGFGEHLQARLVRFKLRVKADIEALDWQCLAVRGPEAGRVPDGLDASWPGLPGVDLLGPQPSPPPGIPMVSTEAYEAVRIEAGVPSMGAELTDRTIPAETGIVDRTVSFTKGCYTGQELVARIDSRGGHVPRHLRGVVLSGPAPAGATVEVDGKNAGALTSVGLRPEGAVALAYVGRDVTPPASATVSWEGGTTSGRVEVLPLVA